MNTRDPKIFTEEVAKMLALRGAEVAINAPLSLVVRGKHVGLEATLRQAKMDMRDGGSPLVAVKRHVDIILASEQALDDPPWEAVRKMLMPRICGQRVFDGLDRDQSVHQPFVNGTEIVYFVDYATHATSIKSEQMQRWGMTIDDVDAVARDNLARYGNGEVNIEYTTAPEGGEAAFIHNCDAYDSSRLLHPALHSRLSPRLGMEFHAIIPCRDMLIAFNGPWTLGDRIVQMGRVEYARRPFQITPRVFVVTRDGIAGDGEPE